MSGGYSGRADGLASFCIVMASCCIVVSRLVAGYVRKFLHYTYTAQSQYVSTIQSLCFGTKYAHYSLGLLLTGLNSHSKLTPRGAVSQLSLAGIYDGSVCGGEAMPWLRW